MKTAILNEWDVDHDGKINKSELTMLLMEQGKLAEEDE